MDLTTNKGGEIKTVKFTVRRRCRKGRAVPPVWGPFVTLGVYSGLEEALTHAKHDAGFFKNREVSVWLKKIIIQVFNPEGGALGQAQIKEEAAQKKRGRKKLTPKRK